MRGPDQQYFDWLDKPRDPRIAAMYQSLTKSCLACPGSGRIESTHDAQQSFPKATEQPFSIGDDLSGVQASR